jgi:Domain of unknown function (DUF1127)
MLLSFLTSAQRRRIAARNFRVLSALDDDTLRDVGLDRRTLQTFCDYGCTHDPAPPSQTGATPAPWTPAMTGTLGVAFR